MSAKQVLFHDAARTRIIAGVNILADAVKVTLAMEKVDKEGSLYEIHRKSRG